MEDTDRITGNNLVKIIHQLIQERAIVLMNCLGKDYERLTIVTGIEDFKDSRYILVDLPADFSQVIGDASGGKTIFEFNGAGNIPYRFRTEIGRITDHDIWVPFPVFMEKIQRRRNFRLAPPLGTEMVLNSNDRVCEFNVINMSVGGAYVIEKKRLFPDKTMHCQGDILKKIMIQCQEWSVKTRINIEKAHLIRVEKDIKTGRHKLAIEFIQLGNKEHRELENFLQECQREILKKRSALH